MPTILAGEMVKGLTLKDMQYIEPDSKGKVQEVLYHSTRNK